MNENLQTNELTFQKVFDSIKRSFVRIVIYVLIAAILSGGITAIVTVASKGAVEYKSIIEYNYSGAEDGKDPLDNVLDTNKIKSTLIVNNALKNMGISDALLTNYSQILVDSIAITGYVSAKMANDLSEDETLTYYPTRYTITLTESDQLNFNSTKYEKFLNELVNSYIEYFKETYDYGTILSLSIADNALASSNDYINLSTDYKLALNNMLVELQALKNNIPEKFNKINSNITSLKNELTAIENYILTNNVVKSTASMTLTKNLTALKTEYTNLSLRYSGLAEDLYNNVIKSYTFSTSSVTSATGAITITSASTSAYDDLILKYNEYLSHQYNYTYEASQIDSELAIIGINACTPAQIAEVESKFNKFAIKLQNTLDTTNLELTEYSKLNVTENGVEIAMTATKSQSIDYTLIFIVAIVSAVIGFIAAIIVTEIKRKKGAKVENIAPIEVTEEK